MWHFISSLTFALTPFRWFWPGVRTTELDYIFRAGPFTIILTNG